MHYSSETDICKECTPRSDFENLPEPPPSPPPPLNLHVLWGEALQGVKIAPTTTSSLYTRDAQMSPMAALPKCTVQFRQEEKGRNGSTPRFQSAPTPPATMTKRCPHCTNGCPGGEGEERKHFQACRVPPPTLQQCVQEVQESPRTALPRYKAYIYREQGRKRSQYDIAQVFSHVLRQEVQSSKNACSGDTVR